MGGSYRHIINDDGSFCGVDHLDNLGDAYEALEECYDMIQYLAEGRPSKIADAWAYGHLKSSSSSHTGESLARLANGYEADLRTMGHKGAQHKETQPKVSSELRNKIAGRIYERTLGLGANKILALADEILELVFEEPAKSPAHGSDQMPRIYIGSGVHYQVNSMRCIPAIVDRVHSDGKVDLVAYNSEMGAWSWAAGVPYGYFANAWHRVPH